MGLGKIIGGLFMLIFGFLIGLMGGPGFTGMWFIGFLTMTMGGGVLGLGLRELKEKEGKRKNKVPKREKKHGKRYYGFDVIED